MSPFPKPKTQLQSQAYEIDIALASGQCFFCRRLPLPAELEAGEEEGAVLLELESLSPFPLEHLFYGYRIDRARKYAFVYAAYKRRFEKHGSNAWKDFDAALPEFAFALERDSVGPAIHVALNGSAILVFDYDGESELPARFHAMDSEGENTAERMAFARAQVAEIFSSDRASQAGYWEAEERAVRTGPLVSVFARRLDSDGRWTSSFSREDVWKLDLRDPEVLERTKREESRNAVLWKAMLGVVAVIGILILGELFWGGGLGYLAIRRNGVENREEHVRAIDSKQATTETLRRFQDSNLVPFQMIEALAPYQQWPDIIYRKLETADPTVLVIDARASNRTQVTEFKKRLEGYDRVSSVELSNQVNNPAGSTFTATIRFVPGTFFDVGGVASNG